MPRSSLPFKSWWPAEMGSQCVSAPEPTVTVTVAVPTYRRPARLSSTLPLVVEQAVDAPTRYLVSVLVIDNDPQRSAADTALQFGDTRVRYVHEPRPGISAVRNRALDEAGTDLLVFIDDDEHPGVLWLPRLLQTWEQTGAAGVGGLVVSRIEGEPDQWVRSGGFWQRPQFATGSQVDTLATGNMLLDLNQVLPSGVRFSEVFGLTGGEDTHFSRHLARRGLLLVWCNDSVAIDVVPSERATRSWLLQRSVGTGNSDSRIELSLAHGHLDRGWRTLRLLASGTARLWVGGARAGWGLLTGSLRHRARGERLACKGFGMLSGACGWTYLEYSRDARSWTRTRRHVRQVSMPAQLLDAAPPSPSLRRD